MKNRVTLLVLTVVITFTASAWALMRQSAAIGTLRSDSIHVQSLTVGGDPIDGTTGRVAVQQATNTISTVTNNTILSSVQFMDGAGAAVNYAVGALAFLSDNSTGLTITTNTPTGGINVSNGYGSITCHVSSNFFGLVSNTNGQFLFTLGDTTTNDTWYLTVILPDGSVSTSGALTPTP